METGMENTVETARETKHYDVVVVGGGLAGLTAAAILSHKGKKVALVERGNLGGRAVTLRIKDFAFNFGAHAIYGRDTSVLRTLKKEIGINIGWEDFEPNKAKYDIGDQLTDVPANIQGLFRTAVIKGTGKIKFTFEIFKTLLRLEKGHPHLSIAKWMEENHINEDVREMMLTLASSNFFTKEPEKIPSDVFFNYYQRLFTTNKPVAYIAGGWQALIDEFIRVIESSGGEIYMKTKVESVSADNDRVTGIQTNKANFAGKEFVFAIPPKELDKVFVGTKIEHSVKQYSNYEPSYVYVYDVGLRERIDVPYTYIYDKQNRIFITDISHYDRSCAPEGSQLLQAIAYIAQDDLKDKEKMEEYHAKIEALYDKHFSGWRDQLVVPRVSKRAAAQEIKWTMTQDPMPLYFPDYRNVFFTGDWCQGEGQLSELSFSSAYETSKLILQKD
ncbi:FAD-dependent oxidoreductase [Aneurinibacillus sp. Ricciae_BoGa-3]|uniref:phytoene desaturase family protein n=1 Tax=Aneurinibacillus sp. Ricciae_BoGa-3 TaxID=3022697 RepID=UPI0023409596|nr:FAD-dependent oxidoreductase [Aneurinibacillus sp. Ricciae_BoGa-3]WCK54703.1 FAD-dependent oxidoreductase [Aneurinibacillus sp. Ricciae_BoGa-3]